MVTRPTIALSFSAVLLCGCASYSDGGYNSYDSGSGSAGYSSSPSPPNSASDGETRERSYVDRNGNVVFREAGETTIVRPDGGVTIIQRDKDGTRTTVDSDGNVRVDPPGRGHRN